MPACTQHCFHSVIFQKLGIREVKMGNMLALVLIVAKLMACVVCHPARLQPDSGLRCLVIRAQITQRHWRVILGSQRSSRGTQRVAATQPSHCLFCSANYLQHVDAASSNPLLRPVKPAPQSSFCVSGSSRGKSGLQVESNFRFVFIYLYIWLVLNCEDLNPPLLLKSHSSASSRHTRLMQVATKIIVRLIITLVTLVFWMLVLGIY